MPRTTSARRPNDVHYWLLWAVTAVATSVVFKLPQWTGIRQSAEWPFWFAILLPLVWWKVSRRKGSLFPTLLASAGGVATGMGVAKIFLSIERIRTLPVASWMLAMVMPAALAFLLLRGLKAEREVFAEMDEHDQWLMRLKSLPPEEQARALASNIQTSSAELDALLERSRKWEVFALAPVAVATALGLASLFLFRNRGVLSTLLLVSIVVLGLLVLCLLVVNLRSRRIVKPDDQPHDRSTSPE